MKCKVVALGFRAVQVMGKWHGDIFLASVPGDVKVSGFSTATWKILRDSVPVVRGVLSGQCPAFVELDCVSRATSSGVTVNEVENARLIAPVVSLRDADGNAKFEFGDDLAGVAPGRTEI